MFTGSLDTLHTRWRQKAELFRQHGHEATARAYELCSSELEAALDAREDELLDLQEAAKASGYSPDRLGRLLREGKIPNAGRRHAPRIRRGDLPKRPDTTVIGQTAPQPSYKLELAARATYRSSASRERRWSRRGDSQCLDAASNERGARPWVATATPSS